jgi:tetratricopeptide (TPR) repeat protein
MRFSSTLCAFAIVLTALPAEAQRRNGTDQVDRVTEQLLSARSKQKAGQYSAARDILLEALSKLPDSAALLDQLGSIEQDLGEYLEAERSYLHALSASAQTEGGLDRVVTLNNLGNLYFETAQYAKGDRVREQLEKVAPGTLEAYPAAAAALLGAIGGLEHARNRDHEAESYCVRSLQLFQKANGPVSVDAALMKNNLGCLRVEAGQYDSASDLFRQAIREIEIAAGPENPALVRPLVNLARCENMSGHANRAEPLARRGVELSIRFFGEEHPVTATAMLEQATALRRLRRKGPAHDLEKRAKACLRNNTTTNLSGYTVSLRDLAGATTR